MIQSYIDCNVKMLLLNFKHPSPGSEIFHVIKKKIPLNNKCSDCTIDHPKREIRHGLNANNWKSSLPEMCRGVCFWLNALSGRILTERLIIQSGPLCHYWTADTACLLHTQLLVPDESSLKCCYEGSFAFKCISIKSFWEENSLNALREWNGGYELYWGTLGFLLFYFLDIV